MGHLTGLVGELYSLVQKLGPKKHTILLKFFFLCCWGLGFPGEVGGPTGGLTTQREEGKVTKNFIGDDLTEALSFMQGNAQGRRSSISP